MRTQLHNVAAIIAAGLLASVSNGAMADAIETQHNALDMARHLSSTPVRLANQAGPAGPSEIPGRAARVTDETPVETRYSVYHYTLMAAATPSGQAGRLGPVMDEPRRNSSTVYETLHSAFDLVDRP